MNTHLLALYLQDLHVDPCRATYYEQTEEELSGDYRPEFSSIGYILDGTCRLTVDGVSLYPQAGDLYLLPARTLQSYHFYKTATPHCKYYCHFHAPAGGRDLFERLEVPLCLTPPPAQRTAAARLLATLCALQGNGDPLTPLKTKSLLLQLVELYLSLAEPLRLREEANSPLEETLAYMEAHLSEPLTVRELAARLYLSENHFIRVFKELTGQPPGQYVLRRRLRRGYDLLWQTSLSVTDIARQTGFPDPLYFSRVFKKVYGVAPSAMRRGG